MKQTQTAPVYEEAQPKSKLPPILLSVLLYGLSLLLLYLSVATPEPGTAMVAIQNILFGLGGSLSILLPFLVAWPATLVAFKAASKPVSPWRQIMYLIMVITLYTGLHLFFTETIITQRMTIKTFANFVSKSYSYGHGGGAIGSLLAWPLYTNIGKWGGVIVDLLIALLAFTASGRAANLLHWSKNRAETLQHNTDQRRKVREVEQMFDINEPAPARPVRRRPSDPASDDLYNTSPRREPVRRAQTARPHMEPIERVEPAPAPAKNRSAAASKSSPKSDEVPGKKRRMYRETVPVEAEETLLDDIPEEKNFGIVHAADDSPAPSLDRKKRESRKKEHKPDTSAAVEAMRGMKAKDNQIAIDDEDFTIEPEICDVLESDDPPFDIPDTPKKPAGKLKRTPVPTPEEEEEMYNYPPIDLLAEGERVEANHRDSDMEKAKLLEETLHDFGISSKLTGIAHGPAVTRFELQPAPGVKVSRITSLSDDIAMRLAAMSVRIEAPIPGKAAVGVEIPNDKVEMVRLRDVLESSEARKSVSKIAVGLGKDNSGRYIVADIAKMPHVLIAGQTGSGKSVCINSIITSIIFRASPDEVKMILIDPKMVELSIYNDIPHLICPVVTDCKKAASALDWAVAEMTKRYKQFAERGVRDIKGYNKALREGEKIMPQMVIVIDELADLMMVAPGEVEDSICRLAQLARAAGMHLVIATQRPSVNVITGTIKANIPTRIAFCVASQIDSRTMIDHGGAEKLLGNGDMLFVPSGINKPMRVQGAWVSDEEVHAVVTYIKERSETAYDVNMIEQMDNAARTDAEKEEFNSEYDPRLPEAVEIVVEAGQASVSMLQRRMRVGYARAGRLIDEMEQRGIVSEADGAKPRSVLITRDEMADLFDEE